MTRPAVDACCLPKKFSPAGIIFTCNQDPNSGYKFRQTPNMPMWLGWGGGVIKLDSNAALTLVPKPNKAGAPFLYTTLSRYHCCALLRCGAVAETFSTEVQTSPSWLPRFKVTLHDAPTSQVRGKGLRWGLMPDDCNL